MTSDRLRSLVIGAALALLFLTVPARAADMSLPPAPAGAAAAAVAERPLGNEDLLEISVFEIPELNRTVRVSEKGTISIPLLGEVAAGGLTREQLERTLRERLSEKYVRDPQVSVFVREYGSKKVSVLGAVGKAGSYEMLGPRSLLDLLAAAGGLTEEAGGEVYVIRTRPDGGTESFRIGVEALMSSRDAALNVAMQPGDIVSVPIERMIFVYVDGAVKTPGRIEQPSSRPITLLQAIAKAGGATERANLRKVKILRQQGNGVQAATVVNVQKIRGGEEPDPALQDGDVVVVSETFF